MANKTSTGRIYRRAQEDFLEWCERHSIRHPTPDDIAAHLRYCAETFGITTPPVRLSGIADMLREQGILIDTKALPIQTVLRESRAHAMRRARRKRRTRSPA